MNFMRIYYGLTCEINCSITSDLFFTDLPADLPTENIIHEDFSGKPVSARKTAGNLFFVNF